MTAWKYFVGKLRSWALPQGNRVCCLTLSVEEKALSVRPVQAVSRASAVPLARVSKFAVTSSSVQEVETDT